MLTPESGESGPRAAHLRGVSRHVGGQVIAHVAIDGAVSSEPPGRRRAPEPRPRLQRRREDTVPALWASTVLEHVLAWKSIRQYLRWRADARVRARIADERPLHAGRRRSAQEAPTSPLAEAEFGRGQARSLSTASASEHACSPPGEVHHPARRKLVSELPPNRPRGDLATGIDALHCAPVPALSAPGCPAPGRRHAPMRKRYRSTGPFADQRAPPSARRWRWR